jgi:hypothetical protein
LGSARFFSSLLVGQTNYRRQYQPAVVGAEMNNGGRPVAPDISVRRYLQSALKLSWDTVTAPSALNRKVQCLVHKVVVSWTLADNSKVVYERLVCLAVLERSLKTLLRDASRLVLSTSGLTGTADALWLKMEETTDILAT